MSAPVRPDTPASVREDIERYTEEVWSILGALPPGSVNGIMHALSCLNAAHFTRGLLVGLGSAAER